MRSLPPICHLHLPKTAGTTINFWLETLAHAAKCRPPTLRLDWGADASHFLLLESLRQKKPQDLPLVEDPGRDTYETPEMLYERRLYRLAQLTYSWLNYDILYEHESLLPGRRPDAFVFTIMRDPLARCISQIADHKSLEMASIGNLNAEDSFAINTLRADSFDEFVSKCRHTHYLLTTYVDAQCNLLLQDDVSWAKFYQLSAHERASMTIDVLESRYDFVGILEQFRETTTTLASMLGVYPMSQATHHNRRPSEARGLGVEGLGVSEKARRWLVENNRADAIVYKYALKRFRRDYGKHKKYTVVLFEKKHVRNRIAELSPVRFGREFMFDMNMGFVGTGFHQREGALTSGCVRWSGPEAESHIYMRVPRGKDLRIRIYNKGWTDWKARDSLVIEVDGDVRPHRMENAPRMAEVFVVEARSTKGWMRVTTRIASTVSDADMGIKGGDDRKKGFAIWGYSYEIVNRPVQAPAVKRAQAQKRKYIVDIDPMKILNAPVSAFSLQIQPDLALASRADGE
jgi:hypothetical protein